jgi:beta-glucanase (GH16 family)
MRFVKSFMEALSRDTKRASVVLLIALLHACTHVTPPRGPSTGDTTAREWVLVWSDEFDGAAGARVDSTKWKHDLADGCPNICGWGNNEKEYYTDARENIALNGDGQLRIVARVAPAGLTCYYGPCRYTSAKITTNGKMGATHGRVEARIKLAAGQGRWPALWMLGQNIATVGWPRSGEIDVMENRGSNMTSTSSAIHGPGYSGNTPFVHAAPLRDGQLYSDAFHTFMVEWDNESIQFYLDGSMHYGVPRADIMRYGEWVFDQPFYLILNLAVGGHFDGDPQSDAIFPATMLVDYVRVYRWMPAS